ncbi:YncE family protein [Serratia plymuthica]|uniref:Streptogramin lyase n=1 Tax=Serratia plymuthica TaxID=82996 RepID=A0A2X4TV82_SERPL|nr:YncE family protein [Serratia plymuthica]QPS55562.1 YncE family protein [Serratia plymuthica]QPS64265.1 YncE family protein [Serratia plymuthica]RKS63323.1 YVTN family beta-propeller protein [Serratia plymuthica]CAI1685124.1 Streptogramin lyase [Serratia plymuthica]
MNSATTTSRRFGARATFPLLLLTSMLFSAPLLAQGEPELLRKPVGKGAYEMVYSQGENALYLATSQSRKLDKGGVVYRLDPKTLDITQVIHNDIKPFGAAINGKTDTLFFGNTVNNSVTAIDAKTGEVKGRLVLDARQRTETVKPLAPRELVADAATDTLYITGLGESSVVWVVDGKDLTLRTTITDTGKYGTGLALDAAAGRLYVTNADGELVTIDTKTNKVLTRKKLDEAKEHFFLNLSLDPATHRAFITDSKQAQVLVVDTRDGTVLSKIEVPESLAVLFNPARNEVYVTHRKAGEVSVIDAKSYKLLNTLKTPTHPNSLALSPDGQTLYVSVKQASSREKEATAPDDVIRIALK